MSSNNPQLQMSPQPSLPQQRTVPKTFTLKLIGLVIVGALLLGGGYAWYWWQRNWRIPSASEIKDFESCFRFVHGYTKIGVSHCEAPDGRIFTNPSYAEWLLTGNTSDWKIYRNEQYGFEFKYPAEQLEPRQFNEGGGEEPISSTTASVYLKTKQSNFIFSVTISGIRTFSKEDISRNFLDDYDSQQIVSKTVVAGRPAYKVSYPSDNEVVSDFYFVQTSDGKIVEAVIEKNNQIAGQILSTLRFTK